MLKLEASVVELARGRGRGKERMCGSRGKEQRKASSKFSRLISSSPCYSSMSVSRWLFFFIIPFACSSSEAHRVSYAGPLCPRSELDEVANALRLQCPLCIERSLPEEIPSNKLDKELAHVEDSTYYSVLFYASWCPFSQSIGPLFDALSSMFPQMRHLTVEESSAMPSAFSRFGIHSIPYMLLVNKTARTKYHGPKDLDSVVQFYKETTGEDPVAYFSMDQTKVKTEFVQPRLRPAREFLEAEPYLAFSLLFVILRAFAYFFPKFVSQIKAFWMMLYAYSCANLGIFSELSQFPAHILLVIDAKRAWAKLRFSSKTSNFHKGAKSARVWASSLASVSLGESSSLRSAHSDS